MFLGLRIIANAHLQTRNARWPDIAIQPSRDLPQTPWASSTILRFKNPQPFRAG